jgi:hypothetical protein
MHTNTSTSASNTSNNTTVRPWRGIFLRGPEQVKTTNGREIPEWVVFQGDNEGKPAGRVYQIKDYMRAQKLAENMSHDRELELINEATEVAAAA